MSKSVQVSLYLWQSLTDRIEALIGPMTDDMRAHGGDASRSSVIRAALHEGVKVLESRYLPGGARTDADDEVHTSDEEG